MKRKPTYTFVAVLLTILLVPVDSIASDLQIILTPRGSVGGDYTGNVNLSASDEDEDDDFILKTSVGAKLEFLKKLSGLVLSYDPSFAKYASNDQYDTGRHNLNLNAWTELTKTSRLKFRNAFVYTEEPQRQEDLTRLRLEVEDPNLDDPILERDNTIRRGRDTYWQNTATLNYSNQFSKYGSFNVGGSFSRLENDDPEITDNKEYNASADFNYQIHEMRSLGLGSSYARGEYDGDSEDDFDEWTVSVTYNQQLTKYLGGYAQYEHTLRYHDGVTPDYQVLEPTIGINYIIAENFTLDVGVGYFWRSRENAEDTDGISLDGNLGKTWPFKRGAISIKGSTGFDSEDFGAENLGFNKFYDVKGRAYYDFSRYIVGDVSVNYLRNEYTDTGEDRDNYYAVAKLSYRILKWLTASVGYSYDVVESNIDENDIEDQSVFFEFHSGITEGFPIKLYPR